MSRILVTRSEPENRATAQRLLALGHQPLLEPAFTLDFLDVGLPPYDALAFTSVNGVRAFARLTSRRDVAAFCVGGRTAAEARQAGFASVASAEGDVAALVDLIAANLEDRARLLHVGNSESRGDLAGELGRLGHAAEFRALFVARAIDSPGPELARHLSGEPRFEAALIHSPRAASILAGFVQSARAPAPISIAAISSAAAAPAASFAARLACAASPTEEALLETLLTIA
jgi:uroporphyrinogen-III synthase